MEEGYHFEPCTFDSASIAQRFERNPNTKAVKSREDVKDFDKLVISFLRGILNDCLGEERIFKVDAFKKFIQEKMGLSVPTGAILPILEEVNNKLIYTFGYCLAPVNYGGKKSFLDARATGVKELVLVNMIEKEDIKEANMEKEDSSELGMLFWTICYLYLNNGADTRRVIQHLQAVTGLTERRIVMLLSVWERQRYITCVKTTGNSKDEQRYEVGLRAFMEIGYPNITKFVSTVMNMDYSEEMTKAWLADSLGVDMDKEGSGSGKGGQQVEEEE